MSHLIEYLNENFAGIEEITDDVFEQMESHFMEKFGVTVRREEETVMKNLLMFKYHQLEADWHQPLTHECRGCILVTEPDRGWRFMSRPFDKFFNIQEGHCPIFKWDDDEFMARMDDFLVVEKVDGSLIQLWYDDRVQPHGLARGWRISTSGSIVPKPFDHRGKTFEELFYQALQRYENIHGVNIWREWDFNLDKDFTYMLELATPENMIVTMYDTPRIVMLSKRNRDNGEHRMLNESEAFRVDLPSVFILPRAKVASFNTREGFINAMYSHPKQPEGKNPEGWVIYDYETMKPLAKLKRLEYVKAHKLQSSNWEKAIVVSILEERFDDLSPMLEGVKKVAGEMWQEILREKSRGWMQSINTIYHKDFQDRKRYAMFVQQSAPEEVRAFLFQHAGRIMEGGDEDMADLFTKYMRAERQGKTNAERLAKRVMDKIGDKVMRDAIEENERLQSSSF